MTVHQKIMRAAKRGTGLRLTADEVFQLSRDGAIATCAENDDARDTQDALDQAAEEEGQRWADTRESTDRCVW